MGCGLSRNLLELPLSQRVKLKQSTFVPQPGLGVADPAHAHRCRIGCGQTNRFLDFCDDFRRVLWRPQPTGADDAAMTIYVNLQNADRCLLYTSPSPRD